MLIHQGTSENVPCMEESGRLKLKEPETEVFSMTSSTSKMPSMARRTDCVYHPSRYILL